MGCSISINTLNVANKTWQDLSKWKGKTLPELRACLDGHQREKVRVYTVKTTKFLGNTNEIRHEGSGPNLEGGIATLCTCKHSMRLNHSSEEWIGQWIVGLTSRAKKNGFNGSHYLLYMMKIEKAFDSQKLIHDYLFKEKIKALKTKSSIENPLGDIFIPSSACSDPLDPSMYLFPHPLHSHGKDGSSGWHDDIVYADKRKCAPLLIGEVNNTFVWSRPLIVFTKNRGVGNLKLKIEDLFSPELDLLHAL